jgi:patatin-like phospholipase/acyl hydrolase
MYNVLVLAGGGAMGLIQLRALEYIERQEGKKISDIFDLIIGSSVGAINGGVLASGKSANSFTQLFYDELDTIFDPRWFWWARNKPKYDRKNFIKTYEKLLPKDFMISDCETQFICTSVNRVTDENCFFKSRKTNDTLLNCMLRSFAAPIFFGHIVDKKNKAVWFDGGTGTANMPLDWAFTEALKLGWIDNKNLNSKVRFTCIGTGYVKPSDNFEKVAKENFISQTLDFMSPTNGGMARKQVIQDQVNRMNINEKLMDNIEFRYIDVPVNPKHSGLDLPQYKDEYIEYGDKMIELIKSNKWRW